MLNDVIAELTTAGGVLRAGFNMGNGLLVSSKTAEGEPIGVARDMAESIAKRLGVKLKCVPYPRPAQLADAADQDAWDICMMGAEPARAEKISFSAPYCQLNALYLVKGDSPLKSVDDVDRPGQRIITVVGTAYDLWLTRNIKHAELTRAKLADDAFELFTTESFDVLAGLEERLMNDLKNIPGARLLDRPFTAIQQAVGTPKKNTAAAAFLKDFVDEAIRSGAVGESIKRHGVKGLSVAPLA